MAPSYRAFSFLFVLCIGLLCLTETASAGTVYYNGWVVYDASLPNRVRFDWTAVEITGEGLLTDDSNTELGVLLQEPQVVGNVYQVFVDGVEQPRLNTTSATTVPFSAFLTTNIKVCVLFINIVWFLFALLLSRMSWHLAWKLANTLFYSESWLKLVLELWASLVSCRETVKSSSMLLRDMRSAIASWSSTFLLWSC